MRLKQLELQGFKSFAKRTEFAFPTGITAIVGPNGSGKSNVADAIRWALGEQSLRMLRGKSTEDMIYSGGKNRARAGMAEVLLTLDNTEGWLPIDYNEVTIGRRGHRSGESEYLLNNNRVLLRDINHLLAESGLGQRTYAVIGQGLVDTALSLRPQERRALFEEAAGITVYRSQREKAADRLDETRRNLERVRDILSEITPRLNRLEGQVERFHEHERASAHLIRLQRTWYGYHWGQAQERLRATHQRVRTLEEHLTERQSKAEALATRSSELRRRQTKKRAQLRDLYRRTADLHDQMDAAQRELAALTERTRLLAVQREEVLEELEPIQVQHDAQAERVDKAREKLDDLRADMEEREDHVSKLEKELQRLRQQAQQKAARRAQVQAEIAQLETHREELERELAQARATQAQLEAERDLLARLREERAAFGEGVRKLLEADLPGVIGLLGALVQAPKEWETAVEAALGARSQALVVRNWKAISRAQEILEAGEQAMLLPLSNREAGSTEKEDSWTPPPDAEYALDVIICEPRLRPIVEALLGRTLLTEDLAQARTQLAHLPRGGQCVTRAGQLVAADGTVVVGQPGQGVLAQERAWRELPQRLKEASRRQEELEAESQETTERLNTLKAALQEAEREATETSQAVSQAEGGPLTEARTQLAVARQALESQQLLLQRELATLEGLRSQLSSRQRRAEELVSERKAAEERLEELDEETTRFKQELGKARARIGPFEDELSRLEQEQQETEKQERQARSRVRQMEERVNAAKMELVRCQDRLNQLQERIREELGLVELEVADQVTAQTPLPLRPVVSPLPVVEVLPEGMEEEIQRLKALLRQLGPINPDAPQDYTDTRERHRFLTEQVEDLEKTSGRLREVIAELDEKMQYAFFTTFDAIAANFEDTFTRLFKGGEAQLELTDPEDLLSTGVDIVARPPGKRLKSLALLSGGERALTAAALIFAILRARPTPFCVLDEVDAMLDEANVARFRSMLEELSTETQFVIITHNRATVEVADTVYGISMGADGVSQAISLKLEREKQDQT